MSKKTKLTIWDQSRFKSTSVENKSGYQTRKEFLEQEEQEQARIAASEERRQTAPLREAERELREAAREASARIAMYWKIPIEEIRMNPVSITRADIAGDYEIGPRDTEKENAAWQEFQANLASCGCTLSDAGLLRLSQYLVSLNYHRGISLKSVSNFAKALERLVSLDVFPAGEITGYRLTTKTVEQPQQTQTEVNPLDELESLSLESRAGNRRAKELCNNHFFSREFAHVVDQWEGWLLATFNYVLTDDVRKAAGQWWERNPTENPLRGESWTSLRLNLVKKHFMPESCLTREEILNQTIEASSDRSDSYEVRRNLRQQIRDLGR